MGNTMPPTELNMCNSKSQFLCKACGPLFQGHILVYDPMHDVAEWIRIKGIVSDLLEAEEAFTVKMLHFIPVGRSQGAERIFR